MRYYSKATGCTYLTGIHSEFPKDAVPISEYLYRTVIANPEPSMARSHDAQGLPILVETPLATRTRTRAQVEADRLLSYSIR